MLNEQLLNVACTVCTFESEQFGTSLARDVEVILKFYEQDDEDIPIQFKLKYSLAKTLTKLKLAGRNREAIFDSIKTSTKFESINAFISILENRELNPDEILKIVNHVKLKKRFVASIGNFNELREFVDNFDQNTFDSMDDAMTAYENLVTKSYSSYSAEKRSQDVSSIKSLNLCSDDFSPILNQIGDNYSGKFCVPSGFPSFDQNILNGGFEPGRLYIFGGASNSGKSTWMINLLRGAINFKRPETESTGKKDLYVFITLEDFIDESLLRLYCSETQRHVGKVVENYESERENISKTLKAVHNKNNTMLDMTYFVPTSVSTTDLMLHLEEIKEQYADEAILRGVYIDYLDLMKAGQKFDLHRLELGQIAIDLKVLASSMGVPVITLTQLNRAAYDMKENPSLAMMGESIKKVEHADFVALLKAIHDTNDEGETKDTGTMEVFVGKHRSGPKNKKVAFRQNFPKFRIDDSRGVNTNVSFTEEVDIGSDAIL
jgi:replicative DNA helicase